MHCFADNFGSSRDLDAGASARLHPFRRFKGLGFRVKSSSRAAQEDVSQRSQPRKSWSEILLLKAARDPGSTILGLILLQACFENSGSNYDGRGKCSNSRQVPSAFEAR